MVFPSMRALLAQRFHGNFDEVVLGVKHRNLVCWQVGAKGAAAGNSKTTNVRSHLGTLALKTGNFSKKVGRFSKTQKTDLLKPSPGQKTLEK